jgi:hypothetical protein
MSFNFAATARPHANRDLSQTLSDSGSFGHLRQKWKSPFAEGFAAAKRSSDECHAQMPIALLHPTAALRARNFASRRHA